MNLLYNIPTSKLIITTLITLLFYYVILSLSYKRKHNTLLGQTLQLYLNQKFITTLLNDYLVTRFLSLKFLEKINIISQKIQEYFGFLGIIIYKRKDLIFSSLESVDIITKYIHANEENITNSSNNDSLIIHQINDLNNKLILECYITFIGKNEKRIMLVFIAPTLNYLNKFDLNTLNNAISIMQYFTNNIIT